MRRRRGMMNKTEGRETYAESHEEWRRVMRRNAMITYIGVGICWATCMGLAIALYFRT